MRYELSVSLEETVHPYQMRPMSDTLPVMAMGIPDPAFLKRKVFLAKDAGNDHRRYLQMIVNFGLRATGYCENQKSINCHPILIASPGLRIKS